MFTIFFGVDNLRPDFARFDTEREARAAADNMVNRLYAGRKLQVSLRDPLNIVIYTFSRK